ncbi:MAG TPA: SIR2 family protein [Steroidobacteraceae bacterium]|nr:SIR2 family protein [Steroidobacteraceae bacterium]
MTEVRPYVPDQLIKDAAKHGELVVFVGAGTSMLCGSPDWRGFANQVVDAIEKDGILSVLEAEQLRGLGDARRTLSIAMALAKEKKISIDVDSILHPERPSAAGAELYQVLSRLRPVFVTTNYDKWLDEAGPEELSPAPRVGGESLPALGIGKRPKYYLREHLSSALLAERGAVIHLHGSYLDPSKMVVSLKDYIEHYADERVKTFLSAMFKNYTVLFIGYSLAELEVLDYIIRFNESLETEKSEPRHFLLYPCRSTEAVQTRFIQQFFRDQCGVGVLPYCIDSKGYAEVLEVFKDWSSALDVRDPTILDLQSHLDRCISSPSAANRAAGIRLVRDRPELTSYLLNSLKDPVWFDDLDCAGVFSVEHSPQVRRVETESGTMYQADGWPALRYLEQIAPLAQGDCAARIVDIIRAIGSDTRNRATDNWRTVWSLATIMSRLPLSVLSDRDIDEARRWLSGPVDSSMVGYELGEKLLPRFLDSSDPEHWRMGLRLVDVLSTVRTAGAAP